jgi:hypothetical protein
MPMMIPKAVIAMKTTLISGLHSSFTITFHLDQPERVEGVVKPETYHLRPIATFEEGVPVKYDVAADFACSVQTATEWLRRSPNQ